MTTTSANAVPVYYGGPAWVRCEGCDEFHCAIHGQHVSVCPCPPIEQWAVDPYTTGRPIAPGARQALLDELVRAVQAARTYLGERQRAWQEAQEATRTAIRELLRHLDTEAGIDPGEAVAR